jgi:hypothetical protein
MTQLERARTGWRDARPKTKEDGGIEGLDEVEQRMNEKQERGTMVRASMRRRAVSTVIPVMNHINSS